MSSTLDDAYTFGSWLKQRRKQLRLTQRALAEQAGYAEVTLRKVEADELRPSREMVLRLLAQGLSDAEIADRLSLSHHTVNHHLTSIYAKLGVSSRHAASRYAYEHRLV